MLLTPLHFHNTSKSGKERKMGKEKKKREKEQYKNVLLIKRREHYRHIQFGSKRGTNIWERTKRKLLEGERERGKGMKEKEDVKKSKRSNFAHIGPSRSELRAFMLEKPLCNIVPLKNHFGGHFGENCLRINSHHIKAVINNVTAQEAAQLQYPDETSASDLSSAPRKATTNSTFSRNLFSLKKNGLNDVFREHTLIHERTELVSDFTEFNSAVAPPEVFNCLLSFLSKRCIRRSRSEPGRSCWFIVVLYSSNVLRTVDCFILA